MPVRIDLWQRAETILCMIFSDKKIHFTGFGYAHGCGFSCTVVAEESRDLTLIKGDTQTIHGRSRAAAKHLIQVLHTHSDHQTGWFGLEKVPSWR